MIQPFSVMTFKQDQSPTGTAQGRYFLTSYHGEKLQELFHLMKRKSDNGKEIIRVRLNEKKGGQVSLSNESLHLAHPNKLEKKDSHISRLAGTDINESTTRLYGDIRISNYPILVKFIFNEKTNERLLTIMTFKGGAEQAKLLYDKWLSGQIKESIPDNNITFSTENEQSNEVLV